MTFMPIRWRLDEETTVQPDVLVVCENDEKKKSATIPPVLVIEILSDTTTRSDRALKYNLYEKSGAKYYCVADPLTGSVESYTLGGKGEDEHDEFTDGTMKFMMAGNIASLDFPAIFADAASGAENTPPPHNTTQS